MDGCWGLTAVPCQRWWLSEWVTPGNTAIPGMTSLEDGDLQHSSALAQSPKGDIEPNHPSEINPNSDSRSRSDGRSRRFVQYRVDQSLGRRPRSLLSLNFFYLSIFSMHCFRLTTWFMSQILLRKLWCLYLFSHEHFIAKIVVSILPQWWCESRYLGLFRFKFASFAIDLVHAWW